MHDICIRGLKWVWENQENLEKSGYIDQWNVCRIWFCNNSTQWHINKLKSRSIIKPLLSRQRPTISKSCKDQRSDMHLKIMHVNTIYVTVKKFFCTDVFLEFRRFNVSIVVYMFWTKYNLGTSSYVLVKYTIQIERKYV